MKRIIAYVLVICAAVIGAAQPARSQGGTVVVNEKVEEPVSFTLGQCNWTENVSGTAKYHYLVTAFPNSDGTSDYVFKVTTQMRLTGDDTGNRYIISANDREEGIVINAESGVPRTGILTWFERDISQGPLENAHFRGSFRLTIDENGNATISDHTFSFICPG